MATYSNKNRWVFPLYPNARHYANLNAYFRGMRNQALEVPTVREDFGGEFDVIGIGGAKQNRFKRELRILGGSILICGICLRIPYRAVNASS